MLTLNPVDQLSEVGACSDAVQFVRQGKFATLQEAWDACSRGDWLLWWAGKKSGPPESEGRKKLVLAACECAREVLPIFEKRRPDDKRVRECIETAEQWARGENGVTIADVRAKRHAAYAADAYAYAAYAADAYAYAAYAAADAAADAYADAYAAYADAAYAAADAAADAAYAAADAADAYAARTGMRLRCANIVRKHYPIIP